MKRRDEVPCRIGNNSTKSTRNMDLRTLTFEYMTCCCVFPLFLYRRWHTRNTAPALLNLHRGTRDMLKLALDAAMPLIENQRQNRAQGLVCEFGVGSGKSMRMTHEILPLDIEMHGFDTLYVFPGTMHPIYDHVSFELSYLFY